MYEFLITNGVGIVWIFECYVDDDLLVMIQRGYMNRSMPSSGQCLAVEVICFLGLKMESEVKFINNILSVSNSKVLEINAPIFLGKHDVTSREELRECIVDLSVNQQVFEPVAVFNAWILQTSKKMDP